MRNMRSLAVFAVTAVVYCMSFSTAMALDEAVKIDNAAKVKAKDETVKQNKSKVGNDAAKISGASRVIKEIAAIPKMKIPPDLLDGASAVVIIPGAAKHGFKVSGGSSGGVLLVHEKERTWGSPVFITISGSTLGWQIVPEQMDIVLVLKSRTSVDALINGKLIMNSRIAIVPGRLGPNMKAATAKEQKAEIATYIRSNGAFLEEAVVAGATLKIDAVANDAFYARPKVDAGDIVAGKVVKATEDVKALQKLLADYAATR